MFVSESASIPEYFTRIRNSLEHETSLHREFSRDFDLSLYHPDHLSAPQIETHVSAFLGEKLLKPRSESVWIGADGTLDPDYILLLQKSVVYWRGRGDERAAFRFEKELEGIQNMAKLVIVSAEQGTALPVVLSASDPGDFYVDSEGNKKSVTFVGLLSKEEGQGWRYNIFSLPTRHIGLDNHWKLLETLGDIQRTEQILQQTLSELTAANLIAFPVILDELTHSLDELAYALGYSSWTEIEVIAAHQLEMESDVQAIPRRTKMISEFSSRIFFSVKARQSQLQQEALVDAMSDMFAIEAGGRDYLGLSSEQIAKEIDKNVRLALAEKLGVFDDKSTRDVEQLGIHLGDLQQLARQRAWMIAAFATNPLAQEARATGCGGSGMNINQDIFARSLTDLGQDTFSNLNQSFESTSFGSEVAADSSDDEPEGMFPEGIYKPGHCRGCDKDRKKVWHVIDGGCNCCTGCEHRLAGKD